jgi:rhodanese-related sulfurtransferase
MDSATRWVAVLALACSAGLGACSRDRPSHDAPPPATAGDVRTLSVDEVDALLGKPNVYVFDGNLELYYEKGHLPGAHLAFYDDITGSLLPKEKSATLVFYCKNEMCQSAELSAVRAIALGYTNVFRMPAGIDGWLKAGKRVVRETSG